MGRCAATAIQTSTACPVAARRRIIASVTHLDPFLGIFGIFAAVLVGGLYIGGAAWLTGWMLEPINRGILMARGFPNGRAECPRSDSPMSRRDQAFFALGSRLSCKQRQSRATSKVYFRC